MQVLDWACVSGCLGSTFPIATPNQYSVFKLKLKYKEGVMVQRFVVVFNHHYLGGGPMEDDKE